MSLFITKYLLSPFTFPRLPFFFFLLSIFPVLLFSFFSTGGGGGEKGGKPKATFSTKHEHTLSQAKREKMLPSFSLSLSLQLSFSFVARA